MQTQQVQQVVEQLAASCIRLAAIGWLSRYVVTGFTCLRARQQASQHFRSYLPHRLAQLLGMADAEDPATATTSGRPVPDGYKVLTEGKGSILQKGNDVFYNPAQASVEPWLNEASSAHSLRTFAYPLLHRTGSQ